MYRSEAFEKRKNADPTSMVHCRSAIAEDEGGVFVRFYFFGLKLRTLKK